MGRDQRLDGPQVLLLNFPCSVCYQWVIILTLLQLAMPRNGVAIHRYPESYAYVHTDVDVGQKRYVNVCTYINAHVNIYVNIWYIYIFKQAHVRVFVYLFRVYKVAKLIGTSRDLHKLTKYTFQKPRHGMAFGF